MKAVITIFMVLVAFAAMAQNRKSKSKAVNLTPEMKKQSPIVKNRYDSAYPMIRQPDAQQNRKTWEPSAKSGNVSGEKLDDLKNPFDTTKVKSTKQKNPATIKNKRKGSTTLNTSKQKIEPSYLDSSFRLKQNNTKYNQTKPNEQIKISDNSEKINYIGETEKNKTTGEKQATSFQEVSGIGMEVTEIKSPREAASGHSSGKKRKRIKN